MYFLSIRCAVPEKRSTPQDLIDICGYPLTGTEVWDDVPCELPHQQEEKKSKREKLHRTFPPGKAAIVRGSPISRLGRS